MGRKAKVLFVIHDLYQEDNHFPLGPAYLAAVLKKYGTEVEVYCQDVFHYGNDELATFLDNNEYDIIGVGFLAARFTETVETLCSVINRYKKDAWLVLGGSGPSPIPEFILNRTKADIAALGEAEDTVPELVKCKLGDRNLSGVEGIAYLQGGKVIVNRRRQPPKDLDSIPFPEWSIFPMDRYTRCLRPFKAEEEDIAFGIVTSRGCVNRCNFCYRLENGLRIRSVQNIIEEIGALNKKYGVNYFLMNDELFVLSKTRMSQFKEALKRYGLTIKFSCNARVDLFDEELAALLKDCGCQFLNFGMESSDQNVLDIMNKNTSVEQNVRAAEIVRKANIGLGLNFIWGNIGDTEESLRNNVELIKRYNTYDQLRTIRPVTAYPGCDLYYEAIKRRLLKGAEDFFDRFKNSDLAAVNFTDIPNDEYYGLLFEANKELITDYYSHTTKDMDSANRLINNFYELYFKGNFKFRGARHYAKDSQS